MELYAFDRQARRWRTPMISPSSAVAVTSSSSGTRSRSIASEWYRVTANGDGTPANTPRPSCVTGESLPCITRCARTMRPAERLADGLVPEADAEDRDLARQSAG